MKTDKAFQLSNAKLTAAECELFYGAIMDLSNSDKWIIDSPVGKQVANWLMKKNRNYSTKKVNTQFESFVSPVDGSEISCKRSLREHERKHGIRQVGTDIKTNGE